jgi:predicted aspartyl protease
MSRTLASTALIAPATAEVRLERTFLADSTSTSTKTEAPALVLGGTFVILATVNGTTPAALRVDSGATDVMLPRNVAVRLISNGSLTHADYVSTKSYRLADGSLRTQKVYRLRSLKVGALIVRDIHCTISNDEAARAEFSEQSPGLGDRQSSARADAYILSSGCACEKAGRVNRPKLAKW